jgi:putative membrane-bound dehydrogenase-like protein
MNHRWCALALAAAIVGLPLCISGGDDSEASLAERLPRLPPVEPEDALATFAVQQGFALELAAHEPLIADPVDACFDAEGRLYVAEFHGYPYSEEVRDPQQPEPIGKHDACLVRLLEDTDQDGVFDKSTVFADGLSWVTSVCCFDAGVFVLAPEHLYYFKDTDGNDVADERTIVCSGFSRFNVQGLANNMKWGLDGRIYVSGGTNGGELTRNGEAIGSLGGRDFSFDPWTMEFHWETGGRQFGHCFDDWGHRFVCSNSNHIQQVIYPFDALERAPGVNVGDPVWSIAEEGPAAPVFRTSPPEPWRIVRTERRANDPDYRSRLPATELVPVGFFTSATGITIYRGDAYAERFRGNAFIGDVGGNLVHRKVVGSNGIAFNAIRADQGVEFITSTDTWFRPVNFVNGPDGCLYILDMYRETIEHPYSVPEDIKAHLDLESGFDRGRIYRLTPPGWQRPEVPNLREMETGELVRQLDSRNAWHRETAQRLLLERRDEAAVPLLQEMLLSEQTHALGKLHCLEILNRLGGLRREHVLHLLQSTDPRLHGPALRHLATFVDDELLSHVTGVCEFADPEVLFELSLACSDWKPAFREQALLAVLERGGLAPGIEEALLTSVGPDTEALLASLLRAGRLEHQAQASFIDQLITMAIANSADGDATQRILTILLSRSVGPADAFLDRLPAVELGLRRRGDSLPRFLLQEDESCNFVRDLLQRQKEIALTDSEPLERRQNAVRRLRHAPWEAIADIPSDLLSPAVAGELQAECIAMMSAHSSDEIVESLIEAFPAMSPELRLRAIDALLGSRVRQEGLISAIQQGVVRPGDLSAEQRQQLVDSPHSVVHDAAAGLLMPTTSEDRVAIIESYRTALESGDATRGVEVFRKNCAQCHRVGDAGYVVGPDLASASNKSPEDLLTAVLDPNREAQASFTSYSAVTLDGQIVTGIIVSDAGSTLTLRQAEGKEVLLVRSEIDEIKSNGVSLMPVGLERQLSPQDLADVIAWIRDLRPMGQ